MLTIEGPVWLDPSSPARGLFQLDDGGPVITFLGGSAEVSNAGVDPQIQMPNAPGRISRALPLFLAEQVAFSCQATVRTWVPWIANGGFVMSAKSWTDEDVVQFGSKAADKSEYIIVIHLKTESEPWRVELRLLQAIEGSSLATINGTFSLSSRPSDILDLTRRLASLLAEKAHIKRRTTSPLYQLPHENRLADYLLREEQLLAVRCARMDSAPPRFLHGEREIIEGNLQLCLASPTNVVTRILCAQTLLTMQKVRPDVVKEFADKFEWLQKEHPLREPVQAVIGEMLSGV